MVKGYLVTSGERPTHMYLCDDCVGSYDVEVDQGKANEACEACGEEG